MPRKPPSRSKTAIPKGLCKAAWINQHRAFAAKDLGRGRAGAAAATGLLRRGLAVRFGVDFRSKKPAYVLTHSGVAAGKARCQAGEPRPGR